MAWQILLPLLAPFVGSFIGLLSIRLPAGQPVVLGRSRCGGCARTLAVRDLLPIASWLLLKGRCRTCSAAIPRRYLLIELGCAALALWSLAVLPWPLAAAGAVLGWWLLLIAIVDAEHFWLPWRFTLPLAGAGLLVAALLQPHEFTDRMTGAAVGFGLLAAIAWAYRRLRGRDGLGSGDPALLSAAGAWVGWIGLPSVLVYACAAGLSLVAAQMLLKRGPKLEDRLPFGSFLCLGLWLTFLYGPLGR